MKAISNTRDCPNCGSNHKTKPFCFYENGWYCFSCGFTKAADRSFSIYDSRIVIPEFPDAKTEFSSFSIEAQLWLTKYNINAEAVREYNIYYCEDNSLIFANIEDSVLKFYQKRNMLERFITTYGQKTPKLLNNLVVRGVLVVVEDYISAIRLHQSGYSVVCLYGTKASYSLIEEWFTFYDNILVWLDNDAQKQTNSGQEAAKVILKMGESVLRRKYGFSKCKNIVNILANEDPKAYTNSEIKEFIRGALNGQQDTFRRT